MDKNLRKRLPKEELIRLYKTEEHSLATKRGHFVSLLQAPGINLILVLL